MIRRRAPRRSSRALPALGASVLLHGAAAAALWGNAAAAPAKPPMMRIYKVDIVSPPPSHAGPRMAEPPAESPGTPAATPSPAPAIPAPAPAAPATAAAEPAAMAPAKAAPAPAAPPAAPAKRAAPDSRKEPPPPARNTTTPPASSSAAPSKAPAKGAAPAPAAPPNRPGEKPGAGTTGSGTRAVPATGDRPVASSSAGEGLNVRADGADFVDRAYLENIIRQVRRRFRPPAGARTDRASVRFSIERDGSVRELEIAGGSGSYAFRSAALEAVERAGTDAAFGPLPRAYPGDRLPITFDFSPPR